MPGAAGAHEVLSGHWLKGARQEENLAVLIHPGLVPHNVRAWVNVCEFFPALHEFFCIAKLKQARERERGSHLIGCD